MLTNYVSEWEIYIGNSPVYFENPKCPGGPHLKSTFDDYYDQYARFYYGSQNKFYKNSPAYGFEEFCNMSGRFTFLVATGLPTNEIGICAVAVFGTHYIRATTLESTITIKVGDKSVFSVPHVQAEDVIGNQLDINLR